MPDFKLDNIDVEVIQKKIKNVYLSVYRSTGHVRVSAPKQMSLSTIRAYVISKLNWIKKQQTKLYAQGHEAPNEFINEESHYYNDKIYLLKIIEVDALPKVRLHHAQIELHVRPGSNKEAKQKILEAWYCQQLKQKLNVLIPLWQKRINVSASSFTIRKMKTLWGSCSPHNGAIRINLELAKKSVECLEYVVVHELVHLLEPSHNHRFKTLMDTFLPKWRFYRKELNRLPLGHEGRQ